MANVGATWMAALILLGWFAVSDASAEGAPAKIQLTNCPATVSLSLPELFAGGTDVRKDYMTDATAQFGKIVLAVNSSARPSVALVVPDSNRIAAKQGSFTLGDIEDIKARLTQRNSDKALEKTNERFGSLVAVERMNILAKESGDTWVALVAGMAATGDAVKFRGYLGMRIAVVARCLVNTMVIASAASITADELMAVLRAIRVE